MKLEQKKYAIVALAMSLPGGMLGVFYTLSQLVKYEVITKSWATSIMIFILIDVIFLLFLYALRSRK